MDELVKSIKEFLNQRASSPLFGAFITSWVVSNYQIFLYIFSSKMDATAKIDGISELLNQSYYLVIIPWLVKTPAFLDGYFVNGLYYPLIGTFFYIYLYPKISKPVFEYSFEKKKELIESKARIDGQKLLTQDESDRLKISFLEMQNKAISAESKSQELSKKIEEKNIQINDISKKSNIRESRIKNQESIMNTFC